MNETLTTGAEILAACEKVSTDGEVTGVHRTYSSLEYCPGKSVPGSGERTGFGLRIIRNGKLGVSGEWGIAKPFSLLEKAIGNCRYGEEALFSFPSDSPESGSSTGSELENLTHDDVLIYLHELQAQIRNIHPSACLSAGIQWGQDSFVVMNSAGLRGSYSKTRASTRFSVTLPSDTGLLQSGYTIETTAALPLLSDAVTVLMLPLHPDGLDSLSAVGRKKVVFSPVAFSLLLQAIRTGVSGKLLAEGASPLSKLEGTQVISSLLTVRDLPNLQTGAASAPFDSEGVSTYDKTLFEDGVFTGFLHDLGSAAECGVNSTGSSGRNIGEHSRPVCTNITVDPSLNGSLNTIAETGSGILVTSILSAGGGNAVSGNFALDCGRVLLFRRGEIHGYCDGCVLTGNVYDVLSGVIALGSRQFRCGMDLLPFISLDGISVR
jgi:predicted Zn-dependent protease